MMEQPLLAAEGRRREAPLLNVSAAVGSADRLVPAAATMEEVSEVGTLHSTVLSPGIAPSGLAAEQGRRGTRFRSWWGLVRRTWSYVLTAGLTGAQVRAAQAVTPTASRTVCKLKATILVVIFSFQLSVLSELLFAFEAVRIHSRLGPINKHCTPFKTWLVEVTFILEGEWQKCIPGGLVLALCLPCSVGVFYCVTLWLIFVGSMAVQAHYPECREDARAVWNFMDEARLTNLALLVCQMLALPSLILFAARLRSRVLFLAHRGRPLPEVMRHLPLLSAADVNMSTQCTVCLVGWTANSSWVQLPCRHLFHTDCIRRWFRRSLLCPVCRRHVQLLQV
eukprot:TRINITY_DN6796_c0_g1_i1.p1 TRINITY_DN6796_c0_g1~~TRINITY_DN6796_c0_g1_i1.p1  ORF type:complete len:337 (-),score=28.36 TRINITY_DN6796_c0_g1_i1:26-1036(-)